MVKQKTPLRINVRQDRNSASRTFGMWFPSVDRVGTLSTRALSDHISAHGSIWTRDIVEGVLSQLAECIPELVSQGYGVKLDGIGTFWPTLKNKKGGMEPSEIVANGFNPETQIIGVNINFMGDQKKLDNLTRHAFQEYCTLEAGYAIKCYDTTVNGKKVVRHYKMPMNEWKNGATFPSELPSDNVEP
jgi:predicted histone-like DNA-binding protein